MLRALFYIWLCNYLKVSMRKCVLGLKVLGANAVMFLVTAFQRVKRELIPGVYRSTDRSASFLLRSGNNRLSQTVRNSFALLAATFAVTLSTD